MLNKIIWKITQTLGSQSEWDSLYITGTQFAMKPVWHCSPDSKVRTCSNKLWDNTTVKHLNNPGRVKLSTDIDGRDLDID